MISKNKEEAKAQMKNADATLNHYMLKPPELKGVELFEYMIKYRGTHVGRSKPSPYLGIYVSDLQQGLIQPTEEELTQGRIMRESVGMGAKLKLVKRKLDNLGYIKSHSGLQNNEARLERLKSQMEMAASLAEINGMRYQEKVEKLEIGKKKYREIAKQSYEKLMVNDHNVSKLEKNEIGSIIFVAYQEYFDTEKATVKKPALIKILEDLINKDASPLNSLQNYNYSQSDMTVQTAVAEMTLQQQTS